MKKILFAFGSIVLAALMFIGGVYASENGLLKFTGDSQIEQAGNDVDEIMIILRQVNDGKISAEEALAELQKKYDDLEGLNPSGLAKKNKELRERVSELEAELAEEEAKLSEANGTIEELEGKLETANSTIDSKNGTIGELEGNIAQLEDDLEEARGTITLREHTIEGLEEELKRANKVVNEHSQSVKEAVKEARGYATEGDTGEEEEDK